MAKKRVSNSKKSPLKSITIVKEKTTKPDRPEGAP
jgi:hypothetical protein